MAAKINERLTKTYVDAAVDAQRQYAETLFSKATARVDAMIEQSLVKAEERLKKALSVIRPENKIPVTLPQANDKALALVRERLEELADSYRRMTGLQLYRVEFVTGSVDGKFIQRALVMLQPGWNGKGG